MHSGEQAAQRPAAERDLGREISDDIDHTLGRRVAPPGTLRARAEEQTKQGSARLWHSLKKRPTIGVVVLGGLAILAADAVGVGELAMGIAVAYGAWQVLRKGEPVGKVIQEVEGAEGR